MEKIFSRTLHVGLTGVANVFLPPLCSHCDQKRFQKLPLCLSCIRKLKRFKIPICSLCGENNCDGLHIDWKPQLMRAHFLFQVNPQFTTLSHGFKYQNRKRDLRFLSQFIRFRPDLLESLKKYSALVPIPIHPLRLRERGYNQSFEIAKEISHATGVTIQNKFLKRIRYTNTQTHLGSLLRSKNLKSAFKVFSGSNLKNQKILLIDDIFTTGSTAVLCAEELLKNGAEEISIFALGKTVKQSSDNDFQLEFRGISGFLT